MIFKNQTFFVFLFLTALLLSCKNKTTQFFIDYRQEVSIPEGTSKWVIETPDIQTDCQVRFEKNDTKRSKVDKIFLKNITLVTEDDLDFKSLQLKSIHIQCPAISNKRIIFKNINTVLTDTSIQFQLLESVEDVKEFIKHNRFTIELNIRGEILKKKANATLILEFLVEGELIKTILHQRMLV